MSIRLADGPSQCSACWQQRPENKHVDFDVNWDGPSVVDPVSGYPLNQIDDLILCAPCIEAAARLLKIDPQVYADLEREVDRLRVEAAERHAYIEQMEETIPRRPGRPRKMVEA